MTVRRLTKALRTGDNVDKFGEFTDEDTISSYTFSNDPTGKIYTIGTDISATFDNIDVEMTRIGGVVNPLIPCFKAYRSGGIFWHLQGIARQTTTIVCENELFDTSNSYNTSTGAFTVPTTGLYRFVCSHGITDFNRQSSYEHWGQLRVNGSSTVGQKNIFSQDDVRDEDVDSTTDVVCHGETMMHLTSGQAVTLVVTVGGGGSNLTDWNKNSLVGRQYTWFSGYMVSSD